MTLLRRDVLLLGAAAAMQACSGGAVGGSQASVARNPGWEAWVAQFKTRARARGIRAQVLTRAFQGAGYLPDVVRLDRNQSIRLGQVGFGDHFRFA
ncbi:MAG: hypothetical protein OXC60_02260, partial [Litoreibacter sp.]|nr:hypothetical protein [Litoreibacter sp.]